MYYVVKNYCAEKKYKLPFILTSVSLALESEGFTVDTYINGEQALQGIRTRPVDLAILDILMPRVNGFDVLRQLRKASAIPVIFLTSKCDDVDETSGLDSGADDYIRKPFKLSILIYLKMKLTD